MTRYVKKIMKIKFVCVEDGLMPIGIRKMMAFVKNLNADTEIILPIGTLGRFLRYNSARMVYRPM